MDIFIMYGIHGDQCEIWALSHTVLTRQYLITDSSRIQFQHPRSRQDVVSFLATKTGSVTLLDFVRADIEKSGPNMFLLNHLLVLFISISRMTNYYNLQTSLALEWFFVLSHKMHDDLAGVLTMDDQTTSLWRYRKSPVVHEVGTTSPWGTGSMMIDYVYRVVYLVDWETSSEVVPVGTTILHV